MRFPISFYSILFTDGDESVWPGQAVRFCEEVSPREEDFLGMIRLDLDISDDNATYREIGE